MSDRDGYRTIANAGAARFEIRGSRFLGHARPVASREAAEEFVEATAAEYDDATHNVPAYRVRIDSPGEGHLLREYQSDDGEPTGSAGKPALNVLAQRDLENVAVVVTRYFGGTELGVGGLARAYSRAVTEAVDDGEVVTRRPRERVAVTVEYDDSGTVRGILESSEAEFEADYGAAVKFEASVPEAEAAGLRDRIRSATSGRADVE
ncbi:MAG: YigZ family protein [Halanaeroarchaeum sp.]